MTIKNKFKQVLAPWQNSDITFLVSKLEHRYSSDSLSKGFLKGNDAKKVRFLDLYYEGDDQIVPLLARMELHAVCVEEEEREVTEKLTVYNIRFLDGTDLTFDENTALTVPTSCVLQGNIWRHRTADKQYGGEYVGNSNANIEKEYHDTVYECL